MNAQKTGYQKRVKYDFPKYQGNLFKYDMSSTDGCIVFPIFYGFEGIYPEYHVNLTCWAMHSFLVNTNIIEKKIPLFFYIERQLWEPTILQLKQSGIPDERFIQWTAPPRVPEWKGQFFAQKLYTILDPFFDNYDTIIMSDSDIFLSTATENQFDMSKLFGRTDKRKYATYGMEKELRGGTGRTPRHALYYGLPDEKSFELWKSLVFEHLGLKTEKVHRSDGGLNAWCPKELKNEFKTFIHKYAKYFGSEEDVNSLYVQYTGDRFEDLYEKWNIQMVRTTPELKNYTQEHDHFFIHTRPYRMPNTEDIEYFRKLIGQYKEVCSS